MEKQRNEQTAFWILLAWCLLPVVMSLYCFLTALTGRFSVTEHGVMNMDCLIAQATTYYMGFRLLGCITFLFAAYSLIRARGRILKRESVRDNPWFYLLAALLGWSVISAVLSDDFSRSLWGTRYGFTALSSYFVYGAIFLTASQIRSEFHRKKLLRLFCGVISYLALLIIIQARADTFLDRSLTPDLAAVFHHHNHFGYVLCMGITGSAGLYLLDQDAGWKHRTLYLLEFAVQLCGLIMNTTFGSYLAVLAAFPALYIFYLRSGRRFHGAILLPVVIMLVISLADSTGALSATEHLSDRMGGFASDVQMVGDGTGNLDSAGTGRWSLWRQTIDRIQERPIFGYGPGGFQGQHAISNGVTTEDAPHNEFLQMAGYTGIPSLLMYLSALLALAVHHWKRLKELDPMVIAVSVVTMAYLFSSCFGNPVFNTAPYFWLFLGLTTATGESVKPLLEPETAVDRGADSVPAWQSLSAVILCCFVLVGVLYTYSVFKTDEYMREMADLQAMRNAELTVMAKNANSSLEQVDDYWYDAVSYSLIPADNAMPAPYGLGTKRQGDASEYFMQSYNVNYRYDEGTEYANKIIRVHIDRGADDLSVSLDWIDAQ